MRLGFSALRSASVPQRIAELDELRGVAALSVVLAHGSHTRRAAVALCNADRCFGGVRSRTSR